MSSKDQNEQFGHGILNLSSAFADLYPQASHSSAQASSTLQYTTYLVIGFLPFLLWGGVSAAYSIAAGALFYGLQSYGATGMYLAPLALIFAFFSLPEPKLRKLGIVLSASLSIHCYLIDELVFSSMLVCSCLSLLLVQKLMGDYDGRTPWNTKTS